MLKNARPLLGCWPSSAPAILPACFRYPLTRPGVCLAHRNMPGDRGALALFPLLDSGVARVIKGNRLLCVQQSVGHGDVTDVSGRADYRVGKPGMGINANVSVHVEVPVFTHRSLGLNEGEVLAGAEFFALGLVSLSMGSTEVCCSERSYQGSFAMQVGRIENKRGDF